MSVQDMLQEVVTHHLEEDGDPQEVFDALTAIRTDVDALIQELAAEGPSV